MNSEKILLVKLNINILDVILKLNGITKVYECYSPLHSDSVDVRISFDKCGVGCARFDFCIDKPIESPDLIDELIITCKLADEFLFDYLNEDLIKNTEIHSEILEKHMTYSVISSNSSENSSNNLSEKELFGISWKYPDYLHADEKMIQKIIGNNIPVQEEDILLVTTQSTLMIFPDVDDDYINERIMAIEIFWIQRHLLKKIDFLLGKIFFDIESDIKKGNFKNAIKTIRNAKIRMQSDLDAYRNTIISVTHTFSLLFETLNQVFYLNKHYNFVQEKMNSCEEVYKGLYSEQQNSLTENIQWIIIILGSVTFFLTFVVTIGYNKDLSTNQAIFASIIFITLSVVSIIGIRYWINSVRAPNK